MRLVAALLAIAFLAGCAVDPQASYKDIAAARYTSGEQPYVALVSMVDRKDGRAAHTAMFINGSQQVIYDPAGTFSHPDMPERGDVHYGADARFIDYYRRYHARFSHYVHIQKVYVDAETAEAVLRRTEMQGASPKMFCTTHTAEILQDVPRFAWVSRSFFPENLRRQFAQIPGVIDDYTIEEDREKAIPTN